MTDSRLETLKQLRSEQGRRPRRSRGGLAEADIGWDQVSSIAEGLAFSPRALHAATDTVIQRYSLGPRGAWILNVIAHGIAYPLQLANVFCVGRSLITAELARLSEAGLIETRPGRDDRRKTELTLTELGKAASAEVRAELSNVIRKRLAGFSAEEIAIAAEVMHALSLMDEDEATSGPDS